MEKNKIEESNLKNYNMKKLSNLLLVFLLPFITLNCSNDDGPTTPNSAGDSFIKLQLDGSTIFNKSSNHPNPSTEFLNATITTQALTQNGTTIPANTLTIVTGDESYQQTGLGKMITAYAYQITEEGTYNFTTNNNQFFYSDTTNPSNSFISQITEPYETSATITITKIGHLNAAQNGKYVSGYITGTAMSGSISNPNNVTSFRLDFNGGVMD
jgi:hypothetical protein